MDAKYLRIRELITTIETAEAELSTLVSGVTKERKKLSCSSCGSESHTARTCPDKVIQS